MLAQQGRSRRVALKVPYFLTVPALLTETDLLCTLPSGPAAHFARWFPLQQHEPPMGLFTGTVRQVSRSLQVAHDVRPFLPMRTALPLLGCRCELPFGCSVGRRKRLQVWHERFDLDPALVWVREQVAVVAT